jgi:hypothetical protein
VSNVDKHLARRHDQLCRLPLSQRHRELFYYLQTFPQRLDRLGSVFPPLTFSIPEPDVLGCLNDRFTTNLGDLDDANMAYFLRNYGWQLPALRLMTKLYSESDQWTEFEISIKEATERLCRTDLALASKWRILDNAVRHLGVV